MWGGWGGCGQGKQWVTGACLPTCLTVHCGTHGLWLPLTGASSWLSLSALVSDQSGMCLPMAWCFRKQPVPLVMVSEVVKIHLEVAGVFFFVFLLFFLALGKWHRVVTCAFPHDSTRLSLAVLLSLVWGEQLEKTLKPLGREALPF